MSTQPEMVNLGRVVRVYLGEQAQYGNRYAVPGTKATYLAGAEHGDGHEERERQAPRHHRHPRLRGVEAEQVLEEERQQEERAVEREPEHAA